MRLTARTGGLLALLWLGGCSVTDNTPDGQCTRTAEADPTVRELLMLSGTNTNEMVANERPLRLARLRAKNHCLADMGLQPPGGVEPIYKPPGS